MPRWNVLLCENDVVHILRNALATHLPWIICSASRLHQLLKSVLLLSSPWLGTLHGFTSFFNLAEAFLKYTCSLFQIKRQFSHSQNDLSVYAFFIPPWYLVKCNLNESSVLKFWGAWHTDSEGHLNTSSEARSSSNFLCLFFKSPASVSR